MLKKITRCSLIALLIISLFMLSACSPHPGAGNWQAKDNNSLNVSRINITFEGTADFYTDGIEEAVRRCFWSASAEQSMQLQCVYAEDSDKKVKYQFIVTDKDHAQLLQDDKIIAQFLRIEPEPEKETKK